MASRLFPLQFDDEEVRRLCNPAAYARADAWQRDGHVAEPQVSLGTLAGEVHGTWQRVDAVRVSAPGGKLASDCSCQQPPLCVHAATLLLHWLRQPAAFRESAAAAGPAGGHGARPEYYLGDEEDDDELELDDFAPDGPTEQTPADELATMLDLFTMAELRDVARRRDVRSTARSKAELARQLAEALSTAESIDAALARLSDDELLTLGIIDLLGPDLAQEGAVQSAFLALGGTTSPLPSSGLLDLALIGALEHPGMAGNTLAVPVAVSQRLGLLPVLAQPADDPPPPAPASEQGLDPLQALLVLVHEAQARPIPPRPDPPTTSADPRTVPSFWSVVVPHAGEGVAATSASPYRKARLTPIPPMLSQAERDRLAQHMGRRPEFVTLALHIGLTLDVIDATDRLTAEPERLQSLCALAPGARRQVYVATLAAPQYLGELRHLLAEDSPLELHAQLGYFGQSTPVLGQAAQLRQLLFRAVAKLPRDVWYDYRSFRERLRAWAPFGSPVLSFAQIGSGGRPLWWISDHADPDQPLDLTTTANWQRLYGQYVDDVFANVMTWLGIVDLTSAGDGPQAFRVKPSATADPSAGQLVPLDDLAIQIPAGMADAGPYVLLTRGAELAAASAQGLRYRLAPERVRRLFDQGVTGPQFLQFLQSRSDRPLPASMREALERWWAGYGRVRLYDDLTLIELADDYLLPELLHSTSLAKVAIHTFSPRLIAVEPQAVERLIAELTRAGHPPSVADRPGRQ